jgi:hypothetical protein
VFLIHKRWIKWATISIFSVFHLLLAIVSTMPGIWIISDFVAASDVIFKDEKIKAYQTPWGNFAHSGIEVRVVKRGIGLNKVLFHKHIEGPYPKDRAISIRSEDKFIYKIVQEKIEIGMIIMKE